MKQYERLPHQTPRKSISKRDRVQLRKRDREFELEEIAKYVKKHGVRRIPSGNAHLERDLIDKKVEKRP